MKYVYTGYSAKENGFLILTDKDWGELAATGGCEHKVRSDETETDIDCFVKPGVTEEDIEYALINGEPGWGMWTVYRDEVRPDENLADAVCW